MKAVFIDALYLELSSGITVITEPGYNSKLCFKHNKKNITLNVTGRDTDRLGFISDFTVTEYVNWLKKANDMAIVEEKHN